MNNSRSLEHLQVFQEKFIGLAKSDQAFNLIECFHNLFVIQLPGKSAKSSRLIQL
ncbi:hypothetical protein KQS06HV_90112 [Klebsiella quasipneumoniae subsp. similipneumoniae]|nr:hypothetical protein KQS06HV_90112 [Klebsiella quasipneumoniae subsp. similipneumoniae]